MFLKKSIKSLVCLLMIISLSTVCISCDIREADKNIQDVDIILKVALFRTSTEIYLFEIDSNGILTVYSGNGYSDDFTDPQFINVIKKHKTALSDEQTAKVKNIINGITEFENNDTVAFDAWQAKIVFEEKSYEFTYGLAPNKNLDNLITTLIEYSPFEIVDSYGTDITPISPSSEE